LIHFVLYQSSCFILLSSKLRRLLDSIVISAQVSPQSPSHSEVLACTLINHPVRPCSSIQASANSAHRTSPEILARLILHHASYRSACSSPGRLYRRAFPGVCQTMYQPFYQRHRCCTDLHQAQMGNVRKETSLQELRFPVSPYPSQLPLKLWSRLSQSQSTL